MGMSALGITEAMWWACHGGVILSSVPATITVGAVIRAALWSMSRWFRTVPQRPRAMPLHSCTMRTHSFTMRGSAFLAIVMYFSAAVVAALRGPMGTGAWRKPFVASAAKGPGRGKTVECCGNSTEPVFVSSTPPSLSRKVPRAPEAMTVMPPMLCPATIAFRPSGTVASSTAHRSSASLCGPYPAVVNGSWERPCPRWSYRTTRRFGSSSRTTGPHEAREVAQQWERTTVGPSSGPRTSTCRRVPSSERTCSSRAGPTCRVAIGGTFRSGWRRGISGPARGPGAKGERSVVESDLGDREGRRADPAHGVSTPQVGRVEGAGALVSFGGTDQDLAHPLLVGRGDLVAGRQAPLPAVVPGQGGEVARDVGADVRSEEHTSDLQSRGQLVCR